MIKYIGSKRVLIPWITSVVETIRRVTPVTTASDLFSGTSRVGHALKSLGLYVTANDSSAYGHTIARCLVEADNSLYTPGVLQPLLDELTATPVLDGWFTETYARQSRYFSVANASKIEAIRQRVPEVACGDTLLQDILLTSLMMAADRVDSTTGVQMAYLKQYAARALNGLELRAPAMLPGPGLALNMDATEAARVSKADLTYLDPPYNQHSYLGNYHVWETLVRNDQPEVYGVACKRVDVQTRKSAYNSKPRALAALKDLVDAVQGSHLILSFSDEGYIKRTDLEGVLATWGDMACLARGHERYIGAKIGIHSPQGKKVGKISHTRNTEYLFVASKEPLAINAVRKEHASDLNTRP